MMRTFKPLPGAVVLAIAALVGLVTLAPFGHARGAPYIQNGSFEDGTLGAVPDYWDQTEDCFGTVGSSVHEAWSVNSTYCLGSRSVYVHTRIVDGGEEASAGCSTTVWTQNWIDSPSANQVRFNLRGISSTHSTSWGWVNRICARFTDGTNYGEEDVYGHGQYVSFNDYDSIVVGSDGNNWYAYSVDIPSSIDKSNWKFGLCGYAGLWTWYGYYSDLKFYADDVELVVPQQADSASLMYCGYIGGAMDEAGFGIAVDMEGCAYVTGYTNSTAQMGFPVVAGPSLVHAGGYDAFIAKVDPTGTTLLYCGYIGGSSDDEGYDVEVDNEGCAYVAGRTYSGDFPIIPMGGLPYNGGGDAFFAKVDPTGTALVYAGCLGGEDPDQAWGIDVDEAGYAYVGGKASSDELSFAALITGPDLTFNGGDMDAFVAKIPPSGTAPLVYCGYIGGEMNETIRGIAVDLEGSAYVAGYTPSSEASFPVVVGPDLTYNGGDNDCFVAKVDVSGEYLNYCGYIGGDSLDYGLSVAVDASGRAYVSGSTLSMEYAGFPVLVGPDLTFNLGASLKFDAFVARVDALGSALEYCGYIGGTERDEAYGIAVDAADNAYVTGVVWSSEANGFPVAGGPDVTYNGSVDAFVAKVNSTGSALRYCGYVGGGYTEWGSAIAVDDMGSAYLTGETDSDEGIGFPILVGPDLTYNGGLDAWVAKVMAVDTATCCVLRGDIDHNGTGPDIADLIYLVRYMFPDPLDPGPPPPCEEPVGSGYYAETDVNGDGTGPDIADLVYLVTYMFQSGPALIPCGQSGPKISIGTIDYPEIEIRHECDGEHTTVGLTSPIELRGLQLEFDVSGATGATMLAGDHLDLLTGYEGSTLKVGILDLDGNETITAGENLLVRLDGSLPVTSVLAVAMDFRSVRPSISSAGSAATLPRAYRLHQNYPNPFNPTTTISFDIPKAGQVRLEIFNILGQLAAVPIDAHLQAGHHNCEWDARAVASGVYLYRLVADDFTASKKMLLLK